MGEAEKLNTDDGIKAAATYYQKSAGIYQSIKENLGKWGIEGGSTLHFDVLVNLMLGQAQEVFLLKAEKGKMKTNTLAKLACQSSKYYQTAYNDATALDIFDKLWVSTMFAKQHLLLAKAYFYKSSEVLEANKYGEQVGYLIASIDTLRSASEKGIMKNISNILENDIKVF